MALPSWAEELRSSYLRGESTVFLLHGNVDDLVLHAGALLPLEAFLQDVLLAKKDALLVYNPSAGIRILARKRPLVGAEELVGLREPDRALPALERFLRANDGVGLLIDYADMLAPGGEASLLTQSDRRAVMTLHRWSLDPGLESSDNLVLLLCEQLTTLSPKLVGNPRVTALALPIPDEEERAAVIRLLEPGANPTEVERLAVRSAGLKAIQIRAILLPAEDSEDDYGARYEMARESLNNHHEAGPRAAKLARMFSGQPLERLAAYLRAQGHAVAGNEDRYGVVLNLLEQRKRALLERECMGLIEFVEPDHDFSDVGGMVAIKAELAAIAGHIREGRTRRVPMGMLFVGPMGTGKTFVAEAFAKSSGLTAIKLKNFRSRWVGATEGNLERILAVIRAIGQVLVIIDEGDRAFGEGGETDGGTSSRVMARLKSFMSDPTNRGRVLFVLMTNRPDKLDVDLKRAGRLDRKIPFFHPDAPEDVEPVLEAQLRRHAIPHDLAFPRDREALSARLVGWSNADVEAVVLAAWDLAEGETLSEGTLRAAIDDYLPSRDGTMLEYMELLAAFEASSRRLLPARYADLEVDLLQARIRELSLGLRRA
ncbi:MAG: AAA family ATPase [Myxococcota bacterium]